MEFFRRLRDAQRRREAERERVEREQRVRMREARRRAGPRRPRPDDLEGVGGWRGLGARLALILVRLVAPRPLVYYTLGAREKRNFDRFVVVGCLLLAILLAALGDVGIAAGVLVVGSGGMIAARRVERWARRVRAESAT